MKLNFLIYTSALKSPAIKSLGVGTVAHIAHFARQLKAAGLAGDLYDLPNGSRAMSMASPFSLTNGFALNVDELDLTAIPEFEASGAATQYHRLQQNYQHTVSSSPLRINYAVVRSVAPTLLALCFATFRQQPQRQAAMARFEQKAAYWLNDYALFEVYKEQGVDLSQRHWAGRNTPQVCDFAAQHQERIAYHKYLQLLCYEQRSELLQQLQQCGIGLIVNLPFGVETHSADVYFHPDVFDYSLQIGCSPEPENGYPEQLWGMAAYREKSPALKEYLEQKMRWLSGFGSGVFFDHMLGWCGQYVIASGLKAEAGKVLGGFIDTEPEVRKANLRWFMDIVLGQGLGIRGEVFGDRERLDVTVAVMNEYAAQGKDVSVMRIPWKADADGRFQPLSGWRESDLVSYGTHDIETPLQWLCNQKGAQVLSNPPETLLSYAHQVLALPMLAQDLPLDPARISAAFAFEMARRMVCGVAAENVLIPWPGLVSLLLDQHRNCSSVYNINVAPGTPGEVDNLNGNWSFFSPDIDSVSAEPQLAAFLQACGQRSYQPFDPVHALPLGASFGPPMLAFGSRTDNKQAVGKNADGVWDVCAQQPGAVAEIVLCNPHAVSTGAILQLDALLKRCTAAQLWLTSPEQPTWHMPLALEALQQNGLQLQLQPGQRKHLYLTSCKPEVTPESAAEVTPN